MLLNSVPFLAFFAVVFFVYWKINPRLRWVVLFVSSYYFVLLWIPAYAGLLFLTTVVNYFSAIGIRKYPGYKKFVLLSALAFDLGVLFIFKYFNFFSVTIRPLFHLGQLSLLPPLGISFYTFLSVAYMVDVYRGSIKPEKHFGYFALFVNFFPQLSAGPIERAQELLPQLKQRQKFNYARAVSGLKLFTFGLFKKMVIADNLALVVDRVFSNLPDYKGMSLILTVILFSWQIYADFSGYTDMARGIARMLGIDLVENFNFPYFATSVRDFWRRWHMSLSRWVRDYLYIPLGGSRRGIVRTSINTVIVFILVGLWHGAALSFVVWGAFHGITMAAERITTKLVGTRIKIPNVLAVLYTYIVISISWIFFRANTLSDAFYILRNSLVGIKSFMLPSYLWATLSQLFVTDRVEMVITMGALLAAIGVEVVSGIVPPGTFVRRQPAAVRYAIYILVVLAIVQLRNASIKSFIYARF